MLNKWVTKNKQYSTSIVSDKRQDKLWWKIGGTMSLSQTMRKIVEMIYHEKDRKSCRCCCFVYIHIFYKIIKISEWEIYVYTIKIWSIHFNGLNRELHKFSEDDSLIGRLWKRYIFPSNVNSNLWASDLLIEIL